jgi:hypothetical protein
MKLLDERVLFEASKALHVALVSIIARRKSHVCMVCVPMHLDASLLSLLRCCTRSSKTPAGRHLVSIAMEDATYPC